MTNKTNRYIIYASNEKRNRIDMNGEQELLRALNANIAYFEMKNDTRALQATLVAKNALLKFMGEECAKDYIKTYEKGLDN